MGLFKRRGPVVAAKNTEVDDPGLPEGRIESAIDRAMRAGEFDNLPGKGSPLPDAYLKAGSDFLVQKILKEQGFVPVWAHLLQTVDHLDACAAILGEAIQDDEIRQLRVEVLTTRNTVVRALNRQAPSPALQRGLRDPEKGLR